MGQQEVLKLLNEWKETRPSEWFTAKDIIKELNTRGLSTKKVYNALFKLSCFGMIQYKGVGIWKNHHKEFKGI